MAQISQIKLEKRRVSHEGEPDPKDVPELNCANQCRATRGQMYRNPTARYILSKYVKGTCKVSRVWPFSTSTESGGNNPSERVIAPNGTNPPIVTSKLTAVEGSRIHIPYLEVQVLSYFMAG